MQIWDSLPFIHPDEPCLSLPLCSAEDNRMFCTEPMASCTHPLLSVYLVLDKSFQTQQNQEQGWNKYFLTLFLPEDTGLFPLLARPSKCRNSATKMQNFLPSLPWRSQHLVDKFAMKIWWHSIIAMFPEVCG